MRRNERVKRREFLRTLKKPFSELIRSSAVEEYTFIGVKSLYVNIHVLDFHSHRPGNALRHHIRVADQSRNFQAHDPDLWHMSGQDGHLDHSYAKDLGQSGDFPCCPFILIYYAN